MVQRYELTDREWALLEPLLPRQRSTDQGHPYKAHRQVVNGMLWILHTGASWRDLPPRYGPWESVYSRFRRWTRSGLWDRILSALQRDLDALGQIEWDVWMIDGTNIRAHKAAAGAGKKSASRRTSRPRARTNPRRVGQQDPSGL